MLDVPPELWVLTPLAIAAGIDLYLTLLLLGAAPTTGLWDAPLPGALSDLDSPSVLIVVGVFYLVEFAAERNAPTALVWNAFHAVIRPVSGVLLALLVLDGQPWPIVASGAALAGVLASLAHAVRSGGAVIRWLAASTTPHVLLVSVLEDVVVIGVVALSLDLPILAFATGVAIALVVSPRLPSDARAFRFAVGLVVGRVFETLTKRRWLGPDELPEWVRATLDDDDVLAPGGALRGSRVATHKLPGAPRFVTGWLLVRGGSPVLAYRRRGAPARLAIGIPPERVLEFGFFRRVDLRTGEGSLGCLFFNLNGPSTASLQAEFRIGPEKNL
jgi:hypothetical protein